ncbi:MAG: vWA domain-containing protein [Verrucomicrobiales bacterium]
MNFERLLIANLVWEPMFPPVFIVLLALVLGLMAVRTYWHVGMRLMAKRRVSLALLRLLAIGVLAALLFQPMIEETEPRRHPNRVTLVAIDTSRSMGEADSAGQMRRLDAARRILAESGLMTTEKEAPGEVRLFAFSGGSRPLASGELPAVDAVGETTLFHQSVSEVLDALGKDEHGVGLFLFSDGHDFEMVSAERTAQLARSKHVPIYPIALGTQQTIPDVSLHIASYQPYTFVKQQSRLQAAVRLMGGEARSLRVELLREGKLVRDRRISVEPGWEVPVNFDVGEPEPGQYEYEIRVTPLPGEREIDNNSAFTFLNVTDARIPVLLVEGSPHWDTTFLRRTLTQNDRVELTTVLSFGKKGPMVMGTGSEGKSGTIPESAADFGAYPLLILGRETDRVLSEEQLRALAEAVEEGGSTVVFARGKPGDNAIFDELAPALWSEAATGPVRVVKGRSVGQMVPLELLATAPGGAESLPELPIARVVEPPKTLAAVEALAEDSGQQSSTPAIIHRRHGRGQVLAIAVGGLWKWSLNQRSESTNNLYDAFWNQMLLNLVARSNANPGTEARLTVSSANLKVGERIQFTLYPGLDQPPPVAPQIKVFRDDEAVADVPLEKEENGTVWQGSMVAKDAGRHRGVIHVGGKSHECRFAVYVEARETTELAPDFAYLRKLAEVSGGRLLDAAGLREVVAGLDRVAVAESNAPPVVKRRSAWDRASVFYLLFALLGLEWFLRRRWGLL